MSEFWKWVNTNAAAVSATAAVVTAFIAVVAIRATASDSRRRTRPYVIVDLRPDQDHPSGTMDLIVENVGQSAARDLAIEFLPPLAIASDKSENLLWFIGERYRTPIPLLAPGQHLANTWRIAHSRLEDEGKIGPAVTSAQVSYRGTGRRRRYSDTFALNAAVVQNAVGSMIRSERASLELIEKHIRKIAERKD